MTTPLSRLQALVKECVPEANQPDFNALLGEFRFSVVRDIAAEIAILTGEPDSRWHATELKQFSDYLQRYLLKSSPIVKEVSSCPIDSQPSEVEI